MKKNNFVLIFVCILLLTPSFSSQNASIQTEKSPTVCINLDPHSVIYEGDVINCSITGDPHFMYWSIDNQSHHTAFIDGNPVIFNPEPTPLNKTYVNLTVYAENKKDCDSDTVKIMLKKLFFGDIHWHSVISDGHYSLDTMFGNAVNDNYLDFTACTDHAELIDSFNFKFGGMPTNDWMRTLFYKLFINGEWKLIKQKTNEYYHPGSFSTLLGFEWTAAEWSLGGKPWTPNGCQDVGHINFYYKEVYPDAKHFSDWKKPNYDSIFNAMALENSKGYRNIGFPHHSQGKASTISFTTNFSFLANEVENNVERNQILRGAEIYSRWGSAIGQYYTPQFPWNFPYPLQQFYNQTDAWIENACWEFSKDALRNQRFVFIASSDTHDYKRPGCFLTNKSHLGVPSGIVAVYCVHNTREEIWNALNNCSCYASQLLKTRANVRFDGQIAYGKWINCSNPLNIRITAQSTFPGSDSSGKSMCPYGYDMDNLSQRITDVWIVKKDRDRGRPWCKVLNHFSLNTSLCDISFQDADVQENDFYWIAVRQKTDASHNGFITFLGPVFINKVT